MKMVLDRERELMRKHVKKVGIKHILTTYIFVLILVVFVELIASYNIHIIEKIPGSSLILREIFSVIAIVVVVFTVVSNIVFMGGRKKADKEFHYYFRTRPLLIFSGTAVLGDVVAIFVVHNTSYPYMVFFTSLIALNVIAIGFALWSAEKAIRKGI